MPGVTENEVDQMIASGQTDQMFANRILEEKVRKRPLNYSSNVVGFG